MDKLRMHSLLLLFFAVAACRGDKGSTIETDLVTTAKSRKTPKLVQTPTVAAPPAPTTTTTSSNSLLPYIDSAKIPAAAVG